VLTNDCSSSSGQATEDVDGDIGGEDDGDDVGVVNGDVEADVADELGEPLFSGDLVSSSSEERDSDVMLLAAHIENLS